MQIFKVGELATHFAVDNNCVDYKAVAWSEEVLSGPSTHTLFILSK